MVNAMGWTGTWKVFIYTPVAKYLPIFFATKYARSFILRPWVWSQHSLVFVIVAFDVPLLVRAFVFAFAFAFCVMCTYIWFMDLVV